MKILQDGFIKNQVLFGICIERVGLNGQVYLIQVELNAHDLWVNFMKL